MDVRGGEFFRSRRRQGLVIGGLDPGLEEQPIDGLAGLIEPQHVLEIKEFASHVKRQPHPPVPRPVGRVDLAVPVFLRTLLLLPNNNNVVAVIAVILHHHHRTRRIVKVLLVAVEDNGALSRRRSGGGEAVFLLEKESMDVLQQNMFILNSEIGNWKLESHQRLRRRSAAALLGGRCSALRRLPRGSPVGSTALAPALPSLSSHLRASLPQSAVRPSHPRPRRNIQMRRR
nr:hypothetical protein RchiOBHm_Chr7g0184611 [Ipomoea batatas]